MHSAKSAVSRGIASLAAVCCLTLQAAAADPQSKIIRVGPDRIPDEYIVVLNDSVLPDAVPETARLVADAHGAKPLKIWRSAIKGFHVQLKEKQAEALSRHPLVKYVEENAPWYPSAAQQTNVNPVTCDPSTTCSTVTDNRLWHLDRIDQQGAAPTNSCLHCADGTGVTVYVVDGGVNKNHQEFGTRVTSGYNATGDNMPADDPCMGFALAPSGTYATAEATLYELETLVSGHGTAAASAVGGNRVGVAKNVTIVPVKVIRCDKYSARWRRNSHSYAVNETMFRPTSGGGVGKIYRATQVTGATAASEPSTWHATQPTQDGGVTWQPLGTEVDQIQTTAMMIDGINWIIDSSRNTAGPRSRAIVSISTGRRLSETGWAIGSATETVEGSIQALVAANMTVVVSANNQNGSACNSIPARMSDGNPDTTKRAGVITVGGSMIVNRPWSVDVSDVSGAVEANPPISGTSNYYGAEPAFDATKAVRDARWICGPGDSAEICNNSDATIAADPDSISYNYNTWHGGSNSGPCVTLFAPAKNVPVATVTGSSGYRDPRIRGGHASGTSWSAPIVAGAAALIIQDFQTTKPSFTPADVQRALLARTDPVLDPATLNGYDHNGNPLTGTPNRLLRIGNVAITSGPTGVTSGSDTVLSVAASGSSLTYQWYRVNTNFDATATRGAHPTLSSTAVGTSSSSYTVTTAGRYWVRVTGTCGSADSDIVTVTAPPPVNFSATATANDTIQLTWSAPSNPPSGASYKIRFRDAVNGAWTDLGTASSPYNHTGRTRGVLYQYEVQLTASGVASPPVSDYAVALAFTNDPLNPSNTKTRIKGLHLGELREAADAWRGFLGTLDDSFTSYSAATGRIGAAQINAVITALNGARSALGLSAFAYTGGVSTPAGSTRIKAAHVQQLRDALR